MTTTILSRADVTLSLKNINHPLDKIFGGIPAGSSELPHASERHYLNLIPPTAGFRVSQSWLTPTFLSSASSTHPLAQNVKASPGPDPPEPIETLLFSLR